MSSSSAPPLPPPPPMAEQPPAPPPKPNTPSDDAAVPSPSPAAESLLPLPADPFVPPLLLTKTREDLQYLLHSPPLLSVLFTSTHPTSLATSKALSAALLSNIALAQHLATLEAGLVQQREATQQKLLDAKALERAWRAKEKEMYQALQPFSSVAMCGRLQGAAVEGERVGEEMVERLLEGSGGEVDVEAWVRGYCEVRKVVGLRRERVGRWGDGRVGGWR